MNKAMILSRGINTALITFSMLITVFLIINTQEVLATEILSNPIELKHKNHKNKKSTVTLKRTTHGVVHVKASDYSGIGYGVGYAFTQDNRCLLAHRIAEVNGRLSEQLGANAPVRSEVHDFTYTSLQSDHYYRGWFDIDAIRTGFKEGAAEVRQLAKGYASGINRFLYDHPELEPCPVTFKGKVTINDIYRIWVAAATVSSGELVAGLLPHSAPLTTTSKLKTQNPNLASNTYLSKPSVKTSNIKTLGIKEHSFGSNAMAIGREGVKKGKSVHLYNPHFPWAGIHRLYMIHVTIPGELDVMGAALGGFPLPLSGFTKDVAWGLTFSPAARWSLADLALESDPLTYKVDGALKQIISKTLSIPVLGEATPREIPFYSAEEGPLIDADPFFFGWWDDPNNPGRAYAANDVNAENTRIVEQFLRIAQAKTVHDLKAQLAKIQGIPWSYVVASDAKGEVFFGDVSAVPNISTADVFNCVVSAVGAFHLPHGIIVLDGTRNECTWDGRMAAEDQPQTIRSDYVANSNNNFEFPNPAEHLTGFSPVLSVEGQALSLRANLGLKMVIDRLNGNDGFKGKGFTHKLARKVFHQARNRGAELLVPGIVEDCLDNPQGEFNAKQIDLNEICQVLADWDRKNTVKSRGAVIFRGLWMALSDAFVSHDDLFLIPASIEDPLNTPSGYTEDLTIRASVRNALARVASTLADKGIPINVKWGQVNKVNTPTGDIAMPGGFSSEGNYDSIVSRDAFYTFDGWANTLDGNIPDHLYGTSYLHAVTLGSGKPKAMGLMPYSQATDPASPWYLDQTKRWPKNKWFKFPFTKAQIAADPNLSILRLERHHSH